MFYKDSVVSLYSNLLGLPSGHQYHFQFSVKKENIRYSAFIPEKCNFKPHL